MRARRRRFKPETVRRIVLFNARSLDKASRMDEHNVSVKAKKVLTGGCVVWGRKYENTDAADRKLDKIIYIKFKK